MKRFVFLMLSVIAGAPCYAQWHYPETKTVDATDVYFGKTYKDPYRWLEDLKDKDVEAWFKAQAELTDGLLAKMVLPFHLHAGGPIGSGKQIVPWVHRDDVCGLIMFAIDHDEVNGPINVTSPHPVPMDDFARGIGLVLHRRSYLRVPEGALRAMFGEGADPMVTGQRALPRAAERLGYEFRFPDLIPALEDVLGPR